MLVAEPARQLGPGVEVDRLPCLRFRRIGAPVDVARHQVRRLHPERVQHLDPQTNARVNVDVGRGSGVVLRAQDDARVALVPGPALPGTAARSHAPDAASSVCPAPTDMPNNEGPPRLISGGRTDFEWCAAAH